MISPIPSSFGLYIFASSLHITSPVAPGFLKWSVSADITGDVSVNPYPWFIDIPKFESPIIAGLSIGAPP